MKLVYSIKCRIVSVMIAPCCGLGIVHKNEPCFCGSTLRLLSVWRLLCKIHIGISSFGGIAHLLIGHDEHDVIPFSGASVSGILLPCLPSVDTQCMTKEHHHRGRGEWEEGEMIEGKKGNE